MIQVVLFFIANVFFAQALPVALVVAELAAVITVLGLKLLRVIP